MVDQLKGNFEVCLTCEAEFHRLAKIDHFADTYRVPHMITVTSEPQDSVKSGEDINAYPHCCCCVSHRVVLRVGKV